MICLEVMFLWKLRQSINPTLSPPKHVYKMPPYDVSYSPYGKISIVLAHLLGRDPTVWNRLQHSKLLLLVGRRETACITLQIRRPHGGTGASMGNMLYRWEKPLWHQIMGFNFYTFICCGKVNHRTGRCGQNTTLNTLSHWMSQKSLVKTMLCPSIMESMMAWSMTTQPQLLNSLKGYKTVYFSGSQHDSICADLQGSFIHSSSVTPLSRSG